ncbi:MAG: PAS domain S-box protein [Pseudomonadota bacterium]
MPLKILAVDNNPVMLKLLFHYLEGKGHIVMAAESGISALDILNTFIPDVMFIDFIMPGISGKNLCKIVRCDTKFTNTYIAILSATAAEGQYDVTRWGADTCIAKGPFNMVAGHIQSILDMIERGEVMDFSGQIFGKNEIQHRQITKELLSTQSHMDVIFNNLSEGVLEFNREKRIVYTNNSAHLLCGQPEEKLLGLHVLELFDEPFRPPIEKFIDQTFASFRQTASQNHICLNNRTVTLDFIPVNNDETASIILIIHDITIHKVAEEKLQRSEAQYRTLVETVPHGIQENDTRGIITFSNATHHRLLGYEPGELIGKPIWHMADSMEDREQLQKYLAYLIRETPPPAPYFARNRTKDGRLIDIQVDWNYKRDDNDVVTGFTAIITDITERKKAEQALKESEERYRDLFENANDLIQIVNPDGRLLYVNRAWRQTFGYSDDEINQLSIFDLIDRECRDACRETFSRIQQEGNLSSIHTTFVAKNGDKIILEGSANCLKSPEGTPLSTRCIFRNVTKQKELEEQLRQSQKMEAIGTLASGIAHDFNNLLSAVMGYTQLTMLQLPAGSDNHKNLEKVIQSSKRAADLVKQILTFSRPSSERQTGIYIPPLVKEAIKLLSHSLPTTIRINHDIDPDCPPILADATQIQQVIMNLCTNAYHSMRASGGTLTIKVDAVEVDEQFLMRHPTLADRKCARLTVSDTGHGIGQSVLDRVFEPYFTTKNQGEGTGLGLAVVHGIITNHHGAITVASEVGVGTTFTVYFPAQEPKPATVDDEIEASIPLLSANILFVDDDNDLADLGKMSLESIGCRVSAFTSSNEALRFFVVDPEKFDLVITDQTMPEMTGAELAAKLMKIRADLPVILCTGHSDIIDEAKARALGIREFLMKPMQLRQLAEIIKRILKPE